MRILLFSAILCLAIPFIGAAQIFVDVTADTGIESETAGIWGGGVSYVDVNQDGYPDLSLCGGGFPPEIHFNQDGTVFYPFAGSLVSENVTMLTHADYDNDGDLDIFITQFEAPNFLYQNNEGEYTDVTIAAGISTLDAPSYGHSWGDINNDGWLDLYVCNYTMNDVLLIENVLYLGSEDGTFTDITASSGTGDGLKASFQAVFVDYDRDGYQDIFVANDRTPFENGLYHNNGDNTFTSVNFAQNMGDYVWSMSAAVSDYNNDGWLDIYVCNNADGNLLKAYNGTTFEDHAVDQGITVNEFCWGANWFDYDNDGDQDMFVHSQVFEFWNSYGKNHLYQQTDDGFVVMAGEGFELDVSNSFASGIADMDLDGDLDIVSHAHPPAGTQIWRNTQEGGNWLQTTLTGIESNSFGIGSYLEAWFGGEYQMQYTLCGESYLCQNDYVEHFGLGEHETIDSLKVTWLSGMVDCYYDVPANQRIKLTEGKSHPTLELTGGSFICPGDSVAVTTDAFPSYSWNNGNEDATNWVTEEGEVWASVLTAFGATIYTDTVEISIVQQGDWAVEIISSTCYPDSLGSLFISGSEAATVSWSPEMGFDADLFEPGEHTWMLEDQDGCLYEGTFNASAPEAIIVDLLLNHPSCHNTSDGSATASVSGGSGPYEVTWPLGKADLAGGFYLVTVEDSLNCIHQNAFELIAPLELEAETESLDNICYDGATGAYQVYAEGGTDPYEITSSDDFDNLENGVYEYLVTDSNDCTTDGFVSITSPPAILLDIDTSGIDANGEGELLLTASGGSAPLSITVNGAPCPAPCLVSPGDYEIEVSDTFDCLYSELLTITGIDEHGLDLEHILVWPNPAANTLQVSGVRATDEWTISDSAGRVVLLGSFTASAPVLDISRLDAGFYILTVLREGHLVDIRFSKN